jgi:hypothetical protein
MWNWKKPEAEAISARVQTDNAGNRYNPAEREILKTTNR